jgi:pimeloyl-ACP methyl ester carboxylesterase
VPIGFLIARTPVVSRLAEHLLPRAIVAQGLADVYGDPGKVTAELVDRYFELSLRDGNRRALSLRLQQWQWGAQAGSIAEVRQPTLLLWGGRDRLIPPAAGRQFSQWIAGSRLVVFDELGHVPQEEDPARTVQPVQAFLNELAAGVVRP